MITITSLLHRQELCDLVSRWMGNVLMPDDTVRIPQIVHFNNVCVDRYLNRFARRLFHRLHGAPVLSLRALNKAGLKDVIVSDPPVAGPRVTELIASYRIQPELYYRETPFHGTLFFLNGNQYEQRYAGSSRVKRIRRLAEKTARKIIDRIFATIRAQADRLADERALSLGIPRSLLITPPEAMAEEFSKAERRILDRLRENRPITGMEDLEINDVAGVKVILEKDSEQRLMALLESLDDCEVVEKERHHGVYSATNLIVRHRVPKELLLSRPPPEGVNRILNVKGLDPEHTARAFRRFVETGEEDVCIEIIVCTYEEMLESEIGRSMHEERIIRQRQDRAYNGQLAVNIEFLIEYLFAFAASPRKRIYSLPVRVWGRYLPDYFEELRKQLFGYPSVELDEP